MLRASAAAPKPVSDEIPGVDLTSRPAYKKVVAPPDTFVLLALHNYFFRPMAGIFCCLPEFQ